MKQLILLVLIILTSLTACERQGELEPIVQNDICNSYIPFYEQQDSNASSISIECTCQDSFVDLSTKLLPYSDVTSLNFNCNSSQFDLIPTMPSVTHLTSDITTGNIQAFPNLEVYRNNTFMDRPLAYQILFLPKLKEVVLFNAISFPEMISTKSWDVFRMTFQNTGTHTIELPANLNTLTNLKELNIRNIRLALFTGFDNLTSLESLKMSNVLWARIPSTPNQWSKLKTLEVSEVELRGNLPDIFDGLDSLKSIYINETEVSTTSQQNIYKAPNLKELTLSYCELDPIPDEIGNLTSLSKLIITTEQNSINTPITLPSTVSNLINLKSVFVSTNYDQFPTVLLTLNNTLESIAIQDNIGSVPPEIGNFTVLKTLTLRNCGLSSLPSEIQDLSNTLDKLYLSGNSFDEETKQQIEAWLPNTAIYF
jgi:Leucine-rich repeat (LRR) protein